MTAKLRETEPVARKPHRCTMCTGPIDPGERYRREVLIDDGGLIYDWLTCLACVADGILDRVDDWSTSADGIDPDTAVEWAEEAARGGHEDDRRAAVAYLERWADR